VHNYPTLGLAHFKQHDRSGKSLSNNVN
jgi:hypothetical protein